MGRLTLRKLLIGGLVSILLFSLVLSAFGVGVMVRGYLWRTGVNELVEIAKVVEKRLKARRIGRARGARRPLRKWGFRSVKGRATVVFLQRGEVVASNEDFEIPWGDSLAALPPGVQIVDVESRKYQVLVQPTDGHEIDTFVVVRPWSPSVRVAGALMTYQIMTTVLVLLLAVAAVSYLAKRLVTPLEELRDWTRRVGSDQVEELSPSAVEEVAALQASFTEMSQRVAEALSSQRRFVADASHELKTPLTAIAGMLELLESRPGMEPEDRAKALAVASKEADRMKTLVADLLVLSRAQAKHSGEKTEVVLAEAAAEQLETLRVLFPEQTFQSHFEEGIRRRLNRDAFGRIVRNLAENAATHAGGGPIEVKIFAGQSGSTTLEVTDQGPGIPAELQSHLFERFYRADEGRCRETGGFGLGLPIVKALSEEAGAEIQCLSELGKGTTFRLTFAD